MSKHDDDTFEAGTNSAITALTLTHQNYELVDDTMKKRMLVMGAAAISILQRLCKAYFDIACSYATEEEVREKRDALMRKKPTPEKN